MIDTTALPDNAVVIDDGDERGPTVRFYDLKGRHLDFWADEADAEEAVMWGHRQRVADFLDSLDQVRRGEFVDYSF